MMKRIGLAILAFVAWSAHAAEQPAETRASVTVRVPPLSVFRSLREVCIQSGVNAVIDFGPWEANQGTLDLLLSQSRYAVRRSPVFAADVPVREVFARWCAANAGFTAKVEGKVVHVEYAGAGDLAVRHQVMVNAPLFAETTLTQDEDGALAWDTMASSLLNAGNKASPEAPFTFIHLSGARESWDSWLASTSWPQLKVPLTTAWNDTFQQVLSRLTVDSNATITVVLSTPSTFFGGVIGYNAQRSSMPIADVIDGIAGSTAESRKKYRYTSALASRIDCARELYRRLAIDPLLIGDVAKRGLISGLLQSYDADADSESLMLLLHECMEPTLANHITDIVKQQPIALRKRYYFGTLPSPKGNADADWKKHFTALWEIAAKDPDPDIRAYAKGSLE